MVNDLCLGLAKGRTHKLGNANFNFVMLDCSKLTDWFRLRFNGDTVVTPSDPVAGGQSKVIPSLWFQITYNEKFVIYIFSDVLPVVTICKEIWRNQPWSIRH